MKRFHVHVSVPDLAAGIRFYSTLFAAEPTVHKDDYAKWMLDDPRVNFAISTRGGQGGVNHLGFQVDSSAELSTWKPRWLTPPWPPRVEMAKLTRGSSSIHLA